MPNKPNNLNNKEFDQGLTLQELRVIIHALKMQELSTSVDERAIDGIKSRIADLPSAENLLKMAENPKGIKDIVKEVGEIMHLIESYPKTNVEYKDRHQSVTGLPPRYKVLDWRKKMNKAESVKALVKLSENLDSVGQGSLSNKLIVCAKKVIDNDKDEKYFSEVEKELIQAGFDSESKLMKEAIDPKFDPRNWFDKERRERKQTLWHGDKAKQKRDEEYYSEYTKNRMKKEKANDPENKSFNQARENAVGKLLTLQRENISVIKQVEKLNSAIQEFNNTYEVDGLDMNALSESIKSTDTYLRELNGILDHTAKKMRGEGNEEFDFSPLKNPIETPPKQKVNPTEVVPSEYIPPYQSPFKNNSEESKNAGIPLMITKDMEKKLKELGWKDDAISKMKPERAHEIINKGKKANYLAKASNKLIIIAKK